LSWCTQALAFVELPVDKVNSRGFNVALAKNHFVKTCCGNNAEAAENGHIFSTFERFSKLGHTPELNVEHTK
jgi:hypothetical protein